MKIAIALLLALSLSACGSDDEADPVQNVQNPYYQPGPNGTYFPQYPGTQNPGTPGSPYTPQTSSDWNAIKGTYEGLLIKGPLTQPLTLVITDEVINNSVYGRGNLVSSGDIGHFQVSFYLKLTANPRVVYYSDLGANRTEYVFMSTLFTVPELSSSQISLGLTASLAGTSGVASLDPTRSLINFKDCGFSVGSTACSYPLTGVDVRLNGKR